jgi:cell division septal protein FtsQ
MSRFSTEYARDFSAHRSSTHVLKWSLIIAGILAGSAGAWFGGSSLLEQSSYVVLQKIDIVGLERLNEQQILNAAIVPIGSNLMQLQYDAIAARIESVPGVKKVHLIRKLPGRLIISVTERHPIAGIFRQKITLIDDEGVEVPLMKQGEVIDVPLITGNISFDVNGKMTYMRAIELVARIHQEFPNIYGHLGEVSITNDQLTMRLRERGALVKTSDPTNAVVLSKLEQFLSQRSAELTNAQYVDLRYPAMIVTGAEG